MQKEFILIFPRSGRLGDASVFSPSTVRPFADSGPRVRGHSRFSPTAYGPQCWPSFSPALHSPSTQTRTPRAFLLWWRASLLPGLLDTPTQVCLPLHDTLLPLSHFIHEWEHLPGGLDLGSPHSRSGYTLHFGRNPPALRRSSADSSKQRLQGFCSTTRTFLPPTERSDRGKYLSRTSNKGSSALLPCSKKGRRPEAHSGSAASEFFPLQREVQDADDENHHVSDSRRGLVCHYRPKGCIFHIQVVQRHRKFLWFAFGGKAYQYKVLPFGLALALRTFTKMHGCCTGHFEVPGHSCAELSGRLAHSGSLQGVSKSSQRYRSPPHSFSWH